MTIHLVGGGWGGDGAAWRGFLDAARARGGDCPRIAVVAVRDDAEEHASKLVQSLRAAGELHPVMHLLAVGSVLDGLDDDLDGLLVGGGLTSAYLDALAPAAGRIRELIDAGVPYAGFSAGSAIAPGRALAGGWLRGGVPVVDEDVAEDLEELTVRDGLDLVPFTVAVHAAQWGTLALLVTAVGEGLAERGVAIDEDTALVVDGDVATVQGGGNVWWVEPAADGASVRRESAGDGRATDLFRRR